MKQAPRGAFFMPNVRANAREETTAMGRKGDEMSEANETQTQGETTEGTAGRTFTQSDVDGIVKERLRRERERYADYDQLKAKAAKFDEAEEASKSELQKATERADKLQKELDDMRAQQQRQAIVTKVAKESGVDAELLATMSGATEDEVKANAELLKAKFAALPGYKSDPHDNGGHHDEPPKRGIPIVF